MTQAEKNEPAYRVGVDLGGTKTEAILLDPEGTEVHRERRPTPAAAGYDAILDNVVALIHDTLAHAPASAPTTIGIGIPGSIDGESHLVRNANTTILIGHPLGRDLETRLGRPVVLENDANCFTLAEARAGAGRQAKLVFGVIMGTGCGGGIAEDGRVRGGPHGIAGEWGHVSIDPHGPLCYCGNKGCIETLISGSGVQARYSDRFPDAEPLTMETIVAGARAGDERCRPVFDQFLDDFGRALGGLISILDPDIVVLGGGLSNIEELYDAGTRRVHHYVFHEKLRTPIVRNELGDSAGVIGAAWLGAQSASL